MQLEIGRLRPGRALLGHHAHEVALGQYSYDLVLLINDDHRPDAPRVQEHGGRRHGFVRRGGEDQVAFMLKDLGNEHSRSSFLNIQAREASA